ncbi:hypothetical protein EVG20_g5620 [Dentipellis fragilis]|uniref:Uncharacterized protein n=1 Tax=Dentipellis fragilis TaxID=205917 RepID=A0A4Y9YW61_9AGAM|nr:hypothetical protein EVG20_g5620 [Dentipellis fragilis]
MPLKQSLAIRVSSSRLSLTSHPARRRIPQKESALLQPPSMPRSPPSAGQQICVHMESRRWRAEDSTNIVSISDLFTTKKTAYRHKADNRRRPSSLSLQETVCARCRPMTAKTRHARLALPSPLAAVVSGPAGTFQAHTTAYDRRDATDNAPLGRSQTVSTSKRHLTLTSSSARGRIPSRS